MTITLQNEELKLSREELELTRGEVKRSADAVEGQLAAITRQNIEATLFQLIRLHLDIINGMTADQPPIVGRAALEKMAKQWRTHLRNYHEAKAERQDGNEAEILKNLFMENFYFGANQMLGHYFSTFVELLRYLDQIPSDLRNKHRRTVRALISSDELLLLFYYGFAVGGVAKTTFETSGIFVTINPDKIAGNIVRDTYAKGAFTETDAA